MEFNEDKLIIEEPMEEYNRASGELSHSDSVLIENTYRDTIKEDRKRPSQKIPKIKFTFNDYDMSDPESVVGNEEQKMAQPFQSRELRSRRLTEFYSKNNQAKAQIDDEVFYQKHPATRNAQTVSIKKRHLPAFQLFVDIVLSLMVTTIISTVVIA